MKIVLVIYTKAIFTIDRFEEECAIEYGGPIDLVFIEGSIWLATNYSH